MAAQAPDNYYMLNGLHYYFNGYYYFQYNEPLCQDRER